MRRSLAWMPLAVVLATALAPAPADARPRKGFYGVVPQATLHPADFRRMAAGNVGRPLAHPRPR